MVLIPISIAKRIHMKDLAINMNIQNFRAGGILKSKWFWMLLSATLIGIYLFSGYCSWAYDDPFITYRYAENLRKGLGFVYNPGEKILSTTTPLFTLILALFGYLWSDLPQLANYLGVIALVVGGIFLWDFGHTWKYPVVGWTGLLLYPTFPLVVATLGSETPLYLAFCLGIFTFYARGRYPLAGLFGALAILTRPDGMLVVVILGIDYIFRVRSAISWKVLVILILPALVWFLFAWIYFGDPLPITLATKQYQGNMSISQKFSPGIFTILKYFLIRWHYWIEAFVAIVGLVYVGWKGRQWAVFLIWPAFYFIAYSILGVSRYFWYYATLVPGFVVLVGFGIVAICRWVQIVFERQNGIPIDNVHGTDNGDRLNLRLAGFLILFFLVFQVYDLSDARMFSDTRFGIYRAAGEWLQKNTSPEDKVGAMEVGIIGYYARRPMVDFAGLIQPEVAELLTKDTTYEDAAVWAAGKFQPRYVVLASGMYPLLDGEIISKYCNLIAQLSGEQYGYSNDMDIYSCYGD